MLLLRMMMQQLLLLATMMNMLLLLRMPALLPLLHSTVASDTESNHRSGSRLTWCG